MNQINNTIRIAFRRGPPVGRYRCVRTACANAGRPSDAPLSKLPDCSWAGHCTAKLLSLSTLA